MSISRIIFCLAMIYFCCGEDSSETSDQKTNGEDVLLPSQQPQEEEEKASHEKFIIPYVPEYPSRVTQPWMLANGTHFIMFYASWCSYSEAALPHFREVLQYVADRNITGIHMGKIEVTKNGDIPKNFKIRSTPTFVMYHRNARYVFEEDVSKEKLIAFFHQVMNISLSEVSSASDLSELQRDHPVVFLLVHDGQRDPDWHYAYAHVAQERGLIGKFAYTTTTSIVQDFNLSKFPTLLVLKDGKFYTFSDSLSANNLGKWITREQHPAFPTVDEKTFRPFTKFVLGRRLAILVVHEDPAKQRITEKRLIDTVNRVAKSRKVFPHFQFLQLTSVELAQRMLQSQIPQLPYLFIYEHSTGYYYPFEPPEHSKGTTESAIIKFCTSVRKNEVEPLGGRHSFMDIFQSIWWRIYTTYQAMVTHRPYLSLASVCSLFSVILFYTVLCLRKTFAPSSSSQISNRARRAARNRARRQQQQQTRDGARGNVSQPNGSIVRRRRKGEEDEHEVEEDTGQDSQGSSEEEGHRHSS